MDCYRLGPNSLDYSIIKAIRYPVMLMVVLIHLNTSNSQVVVHSGGGDFLFYFLVYFMSRNVVQCVNSLFFFMSGFLYFANVDTLSFDKYKEKTMSRVRTLLLPYLLWNLIVIAIYIIAYVLLGKDTTPLFHISNLWETDWSPESMGTPINGPLWFIRDLFFQALLAQITYILIRKLNVLYLAILTVLFYFGVGMTGFAPVSYLFFAFGAFFGIKKISFIALFRKYRVVLYAIALCVLTYNMYCTLTNNYDLSNSLLWKYFGTIAFFNIAAFFVGKNIHIPKPISESGFMLYATHKPLITDPLYVIAGMAGLDYYIWGVNLKIIGSFIIAVAAAILLSWVVKNICPKFYKALVGGR